jgi:hypothetical protein
MRRISSSSGSHCDQMKPVYARRYVQLFPCRRGTHSRNSEYDSGAPKFSTSSVIVGVVEANCFLGFNTFAH